MLLSVFNEVNRSTGRLEESMNRFYLGKRTFLLATLLSLVLLTAQVASAAPVKEETWRIVKSPNGSLKNSELFGMAAISEHDVWADRNYLHQQSPGADRALERLAVEHRPEPQPGKWSGPECCGGRLGQRHLGCREH